MARHKNQKNAAVSAEKSGTGKGPIAAWIACGTMMIVLAFLFGTMVGDGGAANPAPASNPTTNGLPAGTDLAAGLPEGARQVSPNEVPEHIRNSATEPGTGRRAPVQINPPTINLGAVPPNEVVPARAEIRNLGDEPLTIASTRANCGCTTVDMAGTVIRPGRSVTIDGSFNSQSNIGPRTATITVVFEGYDEPERVTINANVGG